MAAIDDDGTLSILYTGSRRFYQCLCRQIHESAPALERHLVDCTEAVHLREKKIAKYKCAKCEAGFDSSRQIAQHFTSCKDSRQDSAQVAVSSQATDDQMLPCSECEKCWPSQQSLGQHMRHCHPEARASQGAVAKSEGKWTSAEHDTLVQAEAEIRLQHNLGDDLSKPLRAHYVELIHSRICELLPTFRRKVESIRYRRRSAAGYPASVIARMSESVPIVEADGPAERSQSFSTAPVAESDEGLQAESSCDCVGALSSSIDTHLVSLAGSVGIQSYLASLKQDLQAYTDGRSLLRVPQSERGGHSQNRNTSRSTSGRGRKAASKARDCAQVRTIFESQGLKRCLQHLRNPTDAGLCTRATVDLFKNLFEDRSGADDDEAYEAKEPMCDTHIIHRPVTGDEVSTQLRLMPKKTAPGPDGIVSDEMMQMHPADLACLFNIFLLHGDAPQALKVNRTTMIPKSANPGDGDWRPITVASLIDRLFAKVLEARLARCLRLDRSQRGFLRDLDGCGENISAYSGVLKYARRRGKPLLVAALDLAKAFDSVRYPTIRRALVRLGVDAVSVELLMKLVHGHVTEIKYAGGVERVELHKGVRQGWPLSPLLFLAVVDELLCRLSPAYGFHVESPSREVATICGLAFADDVILYSDSKHGMTLNLQTAEVWCRARGMRINPNKSSLLYLRPVPKAKRVALSTDLDIRVEGIRLPMVDGSFERVLGVHMQYTGRVDHKIDKFGEDLQLVRSSQLRPSQKISMIRNCLIPMIKFRLVYGLANKGACGQLDRIVRGAIKQILHLPKHFPSATLHVPCSSGGFGIPKLVEVVPILQARLIVRMAESQNVVTRLLSASLSIERRTAHSLGLDDVRSLSDSQIVHIGERLIEERTSNFCCSVHGNGWESFKHAPRLFLDNPRSRGLTESLMLEAVKMRGGSLMTRELAARSVARGHPIAIACRGCGLAAETQGHILSKCPTTQSNRVNRHDSVVKYLAWRLQSGKQPDSRMEVHREFRVEAQAGELRASSQVLRPDIVVVTPAMVVIIEVSVPYESTTGGVDRLKETRQIKLSKYRGLRRLLEQRFNRRCKIQTLIVGCRGGWLASNNKVFNNCEVRFTILDRNVCVERAVKGSINTYHQFLRATREPLIKPLVELVRAP